MFFMTKILNLLFFPPKKTEVPFFPEKKFRKSVETPEKGLRTVRSCQTHHIVPKYIQKAQTQA
jgi:hypothetical protein